MKKILIVSAICLPPSLIGPAILMGNLFKYFPKDSYCVLMGNLRQNWCLKDNQSKLNCKYFFTRYPYLEYKGNIFWRIRSIVRDFFALGEIFWRSFRIIKKEKIDSLFVVSDHFVELPLRLVSWITGKKMFLWLPDVYYRPEKTDWTRIATRIIEPFILRAANTVLATSEATQKYYKEKYNLNCEVLPHSVEITKYKTIKDKKTSEKDVTKIVFTGSVTGYNHDAIFDMIKIINEYPELNMEFVIVSNHPGTTKELLKAYTRVKCTHAERDEIPSIQQSADILFLPLSFKEYETILRTASPSKLPEYLAAGRPIIVYAPSSSYCAKYAKEAGFGLVVTEPDCKLLLDAVSKLKKDSTLRKKLVVNAKKTLMECHNAERVSVELQKILGRII